MVDKTERHLDIDLSILKDKEPLTPKGEQKLLLLAIFLNLDIIIFFENKDFYLEAKEIFYELNNNFFLSSLLLAATIYDDAHIVIELTVSTLIVTIQLRTATIILSTR